MTFIEHWICFIRLTVSTTIEVFVLIQSVEECARMFYSKKVTDLKIRETRGTAVLLTHFIAFSSRLGTLKTFFLVFVQNPVKNYSQNPTPNSFKWHTGGFNIFHGHVCAHLRPNDWYQKERCVLRTNDFSISYKKSNGRNFFRLSLLYRKRFLTNKGEIGSFWKEVTW